MPKTPPLLLPTEWDLSERNSYTKTEIGEQDENSSENNVLNNDTEFMFIEGGENNDFTENNQPQFKSSSSTLLQRKDTKQQQDIDEHSWEETIQELQVEFQSYMEEYSQIKRDLDEKKKALYLEIVDQKEYLESRGADIYRKWDILKEFI